MSKCCQYVTGLTKTDLRSDLDIISFYMSGRTPINVHSFGSLFLFNKARKPKQAGTASRCLECPYEAECAWSAKKIYLEGDMDHVSGKQDLCGDQN
jgi:hypothetical protein